jgi:protein gp37
MADETGINWADSTFNPWIGCTKVGPGCDNCYAEREFDHRHHRAKWGAGQERIRTSPHNWKLPMRWNAKPFYECHGCGWRGDDPTKRPRCPTCDMTHMLKPARRRVFCASLADVFDNEVPAQWRADLFALIAKTPNLDWLLLTKRIGNVGRMIPDRWSVTLPPNVWIGATIVNQEEADRDIPKLLAVKAAVRFVSMEPLLGPVDLGGLLHRCPTHDFGGGFCIQDCGDWQRLHWVIVGGESGPKARPMNPDWVRGLRDQCAAAGVPFLFKQWGEWGPDWDGAMTCANCGETKFDYAVINHGGSDECGNCGESYWKKATNPLDSMCRVGKKAAGRTLDGVVHDAYPEARP